MNAKRVTKIDLSRFKYQKVDCQDKCCEKYHKGYNKSMKQLVLDVVDLNQIYEILEDQPHLSFLGLPRFSESISQLDYLNLERFKHLETLSIDILFNWHVLKAIRGNFTELIVNYKDPGKIYYGEINFNYAFPDIMKEESFDSHDSSELQQARPNTKNQK